MGKELRVAGRRRRSYLLRLAYVGALTLFLACIWAHLIDAGVGSLVYQTSRAAAAGKMLATALVWFQFIAAQLVAMLLLSDAISSEVRKRTLHILAVTPLSGMQIVAGKLAAGLLPIVMLLAISLPLLALVRVFGGVPWDYIVSAAGVTFSATVFTGALYLLLSTSRNRGRGLWSIGPILWLGLLVRGGDILVAWLARSHPAVGAIGGTILSLVNPTDVLLIRTREMFAARSGTGLSSWWSLHCLVVLAASVAVLGWAARRVRLLAAEPAPDRTSKSGRRKPPACMSEGADETGRWPRPRAQAGDPIRRVKGSPVLWKELRTFSVVRSRQPLGRYGPFVLLTCLILAAAIGIGVLGPGGPANAVAGSVVACTLGLHIAGVVWLSGAAATIIPKEREARTLPVLLVTPLEARAIVRDKALAVLRQSLPVVGSLLVLLLFSSACLMFLTTSQVRLVLMIRDVGIFLGFYLAALAAVFPFLLGLGLYCGTRFKTVAAARGCTFAVVLLGVPVCGTVAAALILFVAHSGSHARLTALAMTVGTALVCAGAGLILMCAASRRLRRNVF